LEIIFLYAFLHTENATQYSAKAPVKKLAYSENTAEFLKGLFKPECLFMRKKMLFIKSDDFRKLFPFYFEKNLIANKMMNLTKSSRLFLGAMTLSTIAIVPSFAQKKDKDNNVYVANTTFAQGVKESPEVALKEKEDGGKKVLSMQPSKGLAKALTIGIFEFDEKTTTLAGSKVYKLRSGFQYEKQTKSLSSGARLVEIEPNVYLVYQGDTKSSSGGASAIKKPEFKIVLAKDEATAKAWVDKAQEKVREFEGKVMSKVSAEEGVAARAQYANERMPAPAKMHNKENAAKAKEILSSYLAKDGGTIQQVVVVSDDWAIARNKNSGVILYRYFNVVIAESHPNHPDGICMRFVGSIIQDHDGKDFKGNWYTKGVSQSLKYGTYIPTENLNK